MNVHRWDDSRFGPLSEAAVRARYSESLHRVFLRELEEPAEMRGVAPERILIMLHGEASLHTQLGQAVLRPGDVAQLGGGPFTFTTRGPVQFMAVYRLPAQEWVQ